MDLKFETPFRFMSRVVKILIPSKTLSKIELVVYSDVGCVRVGLN